MTPDRDDLSGRQVFEILAREHADMLVSFLRKTPKAKAPHPQHRIRV